jgi:phosphoglycerate dehydrogenase-like enzyme
MQIVFPDDWNGTFAAAPEVERLRARADVVVHRVRPPDLRGALKDADVAVAVRERTRYDTPLLNALPRLKLIVSVGGADNPSIDKQTAAERGAGVPYRTRGLIDRSLLSRMKPDAILVNTSRGPIVVEADLVDALQQGTIGGAALDVYDQEPLPVDHPLRRAEHTLLLAHCGWPTDASYARMVPETVAVIEAFLDGSPINVERPPASSYPGRT